MSFRYRLTGLLTAMLALAGCVSVAPPAPGTPEFAASQFSRAYDCGIRVDRRRVLARLAAEDRRRFVSASASFAVKSYKAPRACAETERAAVRQGLLALQRR